MQFFRGNHFEATIHPQARWKKYTYINIKEVSVQRLQFTKSCKTDWAFVSTNAYATDLWMQQKSGYDVLKKWPVSQVR